MEPERPPSAQPDQPTTTTSQPAGAGGRPFKDPKEPWVIWDDVGHVVFFNLLPIGLVGIALAWQLCVFLAGWCMWDLGWHQNQHDEHKGRRHIHVPLRIVGGLMILGGVYLLHRRLNG